MQQRPADADFARELADIVAPPGRECGNHSQPMRIGKRRQNSKQMVSIIVRPLFHM